MRTIVTLSVIGVLAGTLAAGTALAQAPSPGYPPATPQPPEPPKMEISLSGFYEFNGYHQHNFFLGKDASGGTTDNDDYMIQLFRIQPEITYGSAIKGVMRIDLAQKIFGLDNEQRDNDRPGFSNLFNNKDTNFLIHLDWAYVELSPRQFRGSAVRVGRMKNQLGNMLGLDQDGDGVQWTRPFQNGRTRVTVGWTKQFEGADSLTDDAFVGGVNGKDTDLLFADLTTKIGRFTLNPYVAYYNDAGWEDGTTYMPNAIQYARARFTPNLTKAGVFGLAWNGTIGKAAFKGEVGYLTGKDKVANLHSGPNQLVDVNNGDLSGYTAYADLKIPAGKSTLGVVFGLGSGDPDPMSGKGNITKIRTNGFFYVNEVWEDSIMPDEEGITPQGLGSPASRGYREFENTTLVQANYSVPLAKEWKLFLSGTLVRATEALHPWSDLNKDGFINPGEFGPESSKDLGREIDAMLDWNLMPNVTWTIRGGYMWAGDAAGYLINGTDRFNQDPWELRTTLRFNFSGLKLR